MFTEELAREVGVAYGLYCAICKTNEKDAMSADEFKNCVVTVSNESAKSAVWFLKILSPDNFLPGRGAFPGRFNYRSPFVPRFLRYCRALLLHFVVKNFFRMV